MATNPLLLWYATISFALTALMVGVAIVLLVIILRDAKTERKMKK